MIEEKFPGDESEKEDEEKESDENEDLANGSDQLGRGDRESVGEDQH